MGVVMEKPKITNNQLIKSSEASKHFGSLRKRTKDYPMFITENGSVDCVLINYEQYEKMYQRLSELEAKEQETILLQRIECLENNPELTISWKDARRSDK